MSTTFPLLDLIDRPRKADARDSQCGRVLAELLRGRKLRKWDIMHELRALNAGQRIRELRTGEYNGTKYAIKTEMVEIETVDGKTKIAEYSLVNEV